ncbi:DUF4825 domain-containing protein [Paenibacillus tarimensis]
MKILAAMMNTGKKGTIIIVISLMLVVVILCGALIVRTLITDSSKTDVEHGAGTVYGHYDLKNISKERTPYIGDSGNVSRLVGHLPVPDRHYMQRYIALQTDRKPYGLTVFYEPADPDGNPLPPYYEPEQPKVSHNNALVLFAMIANVDEITFAFRGDPSTGQLEQSAYGLKLTHVRSDFAKDYDLSELGNNLEMLGSLLVIGEAGTTGQGGAAVGADTPADQGQWEEPDAEVFHAAATSPNEMYKIESFGVIKDVTAGGLYPAEGIQLLDTASEMNKNEIIG